MEEKPNILHELYVFSEWKPEPEYLQKPESILPENISALWKWISFFGPKKPLIDSVTAHKERQQKWHIALGDEGKVIAVLTDNILEIRTKRSDYATIAARTTVNRDAYSQWRKVVWSPDCSFLAVAYGTGVVSFFDLTASNLFNIPTDCSRPSGLECSDNTHAVANIIFMPLRVKHNKWNWEVLIITFDGKLRCYLVSQTDGFKLQHTFSFAGGVSAAAYSSAHSLLYIAGLPSQACKDPSSPLNVGITAWRILNDDPFYKLSVVSDRLEAQFASKRINVYIPFVTGKKMAFITSMVISSAGTRLVCLHCTGEVSVWTLPLLKLHHRWTLTQQPGYDLDNPLIVDKKKKDAADYLPADVNWWSEEELIVSRFSGSVTICRTDDMRNVLGSKPEFLQGAPRVSRGFQGTFVALECEATVLPAKKSSSDDSMEVVKPELDVDDTMFELTKELFKSVLYGMTDMEMFQPKPKRITVVSRIYRLLAVKSTTPEQLFHRRIENGQYSKALTLADTYNLDKDLVYQQQWRKTPVSTAAIQKYLSQVSKKIWAVHQCVDRLPESLASAKELLQFGLQLTNDEILKEVNRDRDSEISDFDEIVLDMLNAYSSELLRCRHVMLFYTERLQLYEDILNCEKSTYVKSEYDQLRSNSLVQSAIELAKEGRIAALACLWPHIKPTVQQLTVLEKLPETINPLDYKHLLPSANAPNVAPEVLMRTDSDWCKKEIYRSIWSSNWSEDQTPDTDTDQSVSEDVTKWYDKRAREIAEHSGLISHALTLITLAIHGREVMGLESVMFHLLTLDTLVYDIGLEDVSLKKIEKLSTLDTCKLFLKKTSQPAFLSDLKQYVVPFLKRHESMSGEKGEALSKLKDLLESLSVDDLVPCIMVLNNPSEFEIDSRSHIELIERCLDAYTGIDQLDTAQKLLDTLPDNRVENCDATISSSELSQRVESAARLLRAGGVVRARGVDGDVTLRALREHSAHAGRARQLLEKLARALATRLPTEITNQNKQKSKILKNFRSGRDDKPTQQDWENLRKDIMELQATLFTCVTKEQCHEIYASSLLTSGDAASIKLAAEVITCEADRPGTTHLVPYDRSVDLVSNAAREYFNSAASLTDPALELARCCLLLVKDDNPHIQEELDLIAALPLLNAFNVAMLPIQVRLCTDRIQLIKECLKLEPSAHLASYKLIHLAKLLRIEPHDEHKREGQVLQLVCAAAVDRGPAAANAAVAAARRLHTLKHAPAAALLAQVADKSQAHTDRSTRRDLFAAAATYCSPDAIEKILKSRLALELEELQHSELVYGEQVRGSDSMYSLDDEFADALTTPVIEKKDLLPPTKSEKKLPLFNYLMQTWQHKTTSDHEDTQTDIEKSIHCQEFYHTLYPDLAVSTQHYNYKGFAINGANEQSRGRDTSSCYLVHHCLGNRNELELQGKVFLNYAEEVLYKDTPLAVSCLLHTTLDGSTSLTEGKTDATTVSTVLYSELIKCNEKEFGDDVFLRKPVKIAQTTLQTPTSATSEQMELIRACLDKLSRSADAARLRACGLSVHAALFSADADYRRELLYSLARTQNGSHLALAHSLANKYSVDVTELYIEHARGAVRDKDLVGIKHAADALAANDKGSKAIPLLEERIWSELEGTEHNALINYFTLLKSVDDKYQFLGLVAAEHVKLLKKVKAASQDLDYKLLLSQPSAKQLLDHLLSIMRPENVGLLTKLLRTLPSPITVPISVNLLYTQWLMKHFFDIPPEAESNKKWMQQYRQCASYFNKLAPSDLLTLLRDTCFTKQGIDRVPYKTRVLMINQAVDYCQQEMENEIKINKGESQWAKSGDVLSKWAQFLEDYHSSALQNVIRESKFPDDDIWIEMELSHGDTDKLCASLSRLLLERRVNSSVLLALTQSLHVYMEAVVNEVLENVQHLSQIENLVSMVIQYHKDGIQFSEDLLDRLMQRSTHFGLPAHKQIGLLTLSERNRIEDGDELSVARFSLQVIRNQWLGNEYVASLDEDSLSLEEGRRECFKQLLADSTSWQRKKALVDILHCWPSAHTHSSSGTRSLQCEYIQRLLESRDQKESLALIKLLLRKLSLEENELKWLMESTTSENILCVLWSMLLGKCDVITQYIPKYTVEHKDKLNGAEIEDELIKELLNLNLFIKLVPTPLYTHIVNYVLTNDSSITESVPANQEGKQKEKEVYKEDKQKEKEVYNSSWAIKELRKVNYIAEAGNLQLMALGVPSALRGFTQSVTYFKNMFK